MIEVEKKFTLKKRDRERLLHGAEFIKKEVIHDTYYDTPDYSLAKKDWWLRFRNGNFELKVSLQAPYGDEHHASTQYRELETEMEIKNALGITSRKPLKNALEESSYQKIISLATTREKYKKRGFTIDLDDVDYGYNLAEIELMVKEENQVSKAEERILLFAEKHGLSAKTTRGKVLEYIRRFQPIQFRALIAAWRNAELLRE